MKIQIFASKGSFWYFFVSFYLKGFDEFMNLVLDDAYEVSVKKKTRDPVGRMLLKGENITLITEINQDEQNE